MTVTALSSILVPFLANAAAPGSPLAASALSTPRTLKEAGISSAEILSQTPESPAASSAPTSTTAPASPYPPIPVQGGVAFTSGSGVGYESSFVGLEGFVPIAQTPGKNLTFVQGRLLLDTNEGNPGGNFVLGHRKFDPGSGRILGGYIGVDVRDTGNQTFSQVSGGVEAVLPGVEFRVNGYLPLSDRRREVGSESFTSTSLSGRNTETTAPTLRFQGNSLLFGLPSASTLTTKTTTRSIDEISLGGFDAEAGVKLAQLSPTSDLRSYLGLYYYGGEGVSALGVRGRMALTLNGTFTAGLSIQGDPEFGTTAVAMVGLRFPGTVRAATGKPADNWARMGEGVMRNQTIAVTQRDRTNTSSSTQTVGTGTGGSVVAQNPVTGQPYVFEHAVLGAGGGNGTFENPFGTVAAAISAAPEDGNGIVYVQSGTNPGIPAFTIKDGVQVVSTGPVQTLATVQQGTVHLPLSGTGTLPTVIDTVTMGNNTLVSGFAITPRTGNVGISAPAVQNVVIRDNQILTNGDNAPAVKLLSVTGTATVNNNQLQSTGIVSVDAVNFGAIEVLLFGTKLTALNVLNNTITTSGIFVEGVSVSPTSSGSIATATISGNTITTSGNAGYAVYVAPGLDASITTATISDNTITTSGNLGYGVFVSASGSGSITTASILGNTITTSGVNAWGIYVSPLGNDGSIGSVTVANNRIPQSGSDNVFIWNLLSSQSICVSVTGNLAQNPGGSGVNFRFQSDKVPFRVVDLPNLSFNNNGGTFIYDGGTAPGINFQTVTRCP